jgi:hypothetical protein
VREKLHNEWESRIYERYLYLFLYDIFTTHMRGECVVASGTIEVILITSKIVLSVGK